MTLKTGVMAAENSALPSQEYITFYNISKRFYIIITFQNVIFYCICD